MTLPSASMTFPSASMTFLSASMTFLSACEGSPGIPRGEKAHQEGDAVVENGRVRG